MDKKTREAVSIISEILTTTERNYRERLLWGDQIALLEEYLYAKTDCKSPFTDNGDGSYNYEGESSAYITEDIEEFVDGLEEKGKASWLSFINYLSITHEELTDASFEG